MLKGSTSASLKVAARELSLVQTQGSPEDIFRAIARCVPVAGGLIGTLGAETPSSPVSHIVKLPAPVIEGWASTPRDHLALMLAPMVGAGPGELISDTQAIRGSFREQLDLLRRLDDAGLGESAGYKVSSRSAVSGGVVHHFMTFALDRGELFTEGYRRSLALLRPAIQGALDRLSVPLIASRSILSQIVDEQSVGYLCLGRGGRIVEINQRMYALATRYLRAARVESGRGALGRFAERAAGETKGGAWQLRHEGGGAMAEVFRHSLSREAHAVGEDLLLLTMREVVFAAGVAASEIWGALTERQREIARMLVQSGRSYKEIAAAMGISAATVAKHVENIYRAAGVSSRPELVVKLR